MAWPLVRVAALAEKAAQHENVARDFDSSGDSVEAVVYYRKAVDDMKLAQEACPEWHRDKNTLAHHASEVEARIDYLTHLNGSAPQIPCERQIEPKQLTVSTAQGTSGVQTIGAAALLGMATGLTIVGPWGGVLFGASAAHMATRDDSIGYVVRRVGHAGAEGFVDAVRQTVVRLLGLNVNCRAIGNRVLFAIAEGKCLVEARLATVVALRRVIRVPLVPRVGHCTEAPVA
mmetsp:Transcript_60417/g.168815  ORF Transcript_60417/g.168815 Transcript_60417/m.168815 type:complete len:231 (-) Transcript_60417:29-721(-)